MNADFIQNLFADRIGGALYGKTTELYKFAKIKLAKAEASKAKPNLPLIDMGVGEPDAMAFPKIIETLQAEATKPENRGYADNQCAELKEAAARYMKRLFNVDLNSETEILHAMGSKAALSILPNCFINPGDVALMTTPGFPIFGTHAKYLGGEVYNLPLLEKNNYLPDIDSIPESILKRAKTLVLNYPNNPTGAAAPLEFYEKVVAWAKKHSILIIQDAAYAALNYTNEYRSIFQVPGAKDVALEIHSLSKSFNMTGWRIAWVCGNSRLVQAYGDMKNNTDSGQFLGIQKAAAVALDNPEITETIMKKYNRRMDSLIQALKSIGFQVKKPAGSFFLYVLAPKAAKNNQETIEFENAEAFSQWLIYEHLISTVPWDDTDAAVRFSVTFSASSKEEEKAVISDIQERLSLYSFVF